MTPTASLRLLPALRPGHYFLVVSFERLDATFSRVEKASALTLPDCRLLPPLRCTVVLRSRTGQHLLCWRSAHAPNPCGNQNPGRTIGTLSSRPSTGNRRESEAAE